MLDSLIYLLFTLTACGILGVALYRFDLVRSATAFLRYWLCRILHPLLYWFRQFLKWVNWEKLTMFTLAVSLILVTVLTVFVPTAPPTHSCTGACSEHCTAPDPETDVGIYEGLRVAFSIFEGDSSDFRNHLTGSPHATGDGFWAWLLVALAYGLPVVVPISALGTAITLLWNYLPHHVPVFCRNWYIFSELDANSIRMARSLNRELKEKKDTGVFIFLRTRRGGQMPEILEDIRELNYCLYPKTEARFLLWPHRRLRRMRFFFLSEKTDENFERMQDLLKAAKDRWLFLPMFNVTNDEFQQELYLLSETESAPMLIDYLRDTMYREKEVTVTKADGTTELKKVKVKRIIFRNTELRLLDRFRAISYDLLRNKSLVDHTQGGVLNILILGFGKIGREIFRTACHMGVIHDCNTAFTICDLEVRNKLNRFLSQCPELSKSVTFYPRILDADTPELDELIDAVNYHYIVVALGDDERNIRVSSRLKQFYRRCHWKHEAKEGTAMRHPQICVNIEDPIKHDYIKTLWNTDIDKTWDKELYVFGGLDEAFTLKVLMPEDLWKKARRVHRELNQLKHSEPMNWDEYQRRSSIACASHMEYIVDDNWLSKYDTEQLADTEHQRWMAYVRSEGMCQSSLRQVVAYRGKSGTSKHIDRLGKLTPCLVETEKLNEIWDEVTINQPERSNSDSKNCANKHLPFRERDKLIVEKAAEWIRN